MVVYIIVRIVPTAMNAVSRLCAVVVEVCVVGVTTTVDCGVVISVLVSGK